MTGFGGSVGKSLTPQGWPGVRGRLGVPSDNLLPARAGQGLGFNQIPNHTLPLITVSIAVPCPGIEYRVGAPLGLSRFRASQKVFDVILPGRFQEQSARYCNGVLALLNRGAPELLAPDPPSTTWRRFRLARCARKGITGPLVHLGISTHGYLRAPGVLLGNRFSEVPEAALAKTSFVTPPIAVRPDTSRPHA